MTSITSISIPPSVQVLESASFFQSSLELVRFPGNSQLAQIGARAFYGTKIKSIAIPASVRTIDERCFGNCSLLTSVIFHDRAVLTQIGDRAFFDSGLSTLTLPSSLNSVDGIALCGLSEIQVKSDGSFVKVANLLLDNAQTRIIRVISESNFVLIPAAVEVLGNWCFAERRTLSTVHIGTGSQLRIIERHAFEGCSLQSLSLPMSVQSIGRYAFANCVAMHEFEIPEQCPLAKIDDGVFSGAGIQSFWLPASVERLGANCFERCCNLESIVFNDRLHSIGEAAFLGCGIKSIHIPLSVVEIGSRAFMMCKVLIDIEFGVGSALRVIESKTFAHTSIRRIAIPSSVEIISRSAFEGCGSLAVVNWMADCRLRVIGERAFSGTAVREFTLPATVERLGRTCFAQCASLTTFTFAAGTKLRILPDSTFLASGLASITISAAIEIIAPSCFRDCTKLVNVAFEEGSELKRIGDRAFAGAAIPELTLPKMVGTIGQSCFENCPNFAVIRIDADPQLINLGPDAFSRSSLTSVSLPKTIEQIGSSSMDLLSSLTIDPQNANFLVDGFAVYTQDRKTLVATLGALVVLEVSGVLTSIAARAFAGARSLTHINFCGEPQLTVIEPYAFYRSGVKELRLPATVEVLGRSCFAHCDRLTSFEIVKTSNLRRIDAKAFTFSGVTKLSFPRTLEFVHGSALGTLNSITLHPSNRWYGFDSFSMFNRTSFAIVRNFTTDPQVVIPSHFRSFGECSFFRCRTIRGLQFPPECQLRLFDTSCFARSDIESITVPRLIEVLGRRCFYNCICLTDLQFEPCSWLRRIEAEAFANSGLKTIVLPNSVQYLDGSAVETLDSVSFESGSRSLSIRGNFIINDRRTAVAQLGVLENAIIPSEVDVIGPGCFESRLALISIELQPNASIRLIEERAFARTLLPMIAIPLEVETIGASAFYGCQRLEKVTFASTSRLCKICEYAFWNTALIDISLPPGIVWLEGHCLPIDCDISISSDVEIPEFIEWKAGYLSNQELTMSRNIIGEFANIEGIIFHVEDYNYIRPVGSGKFGNVALYKHKSNGVYVAVKSLTNFALHDERARLLFMREVDSLRKMNHPCIIQFIGVSFPTENEAPLIAMSFLAGGSLDTALKEQPAWFTPTVKAIIAVGIVCGMIHVHAKSIIHRDLKPDNIVLDEERRPRIVDFGVSKAQDPAARYNSVMGTPAYMAPECFDEEIPVSPKADVYAFAIILFEMITGKPPFQLKGRTMLNHMRAVRKGQRPVIPGSVSLEMRTLLCEGWAQEPEERLSFPEVFDRLSKLQFVILEDVDSTAVYRFLEWIARM